MSLTAAALAILAVLGAASFAVYLRATANPADDAMATLQQYEAEFANETKVLQTAVDLYRSSVAEATALAKSSAPVLAGLQGRVGGPSVAAAEASRSALSQVAASMTDVSVPVYSRGSIDESSLADVARAIDGVRLAGETLAALLADAREARATVVAATGSYRAALASVGAAIETEAVQIVTANDSVGSSFQTAVTDAAARVITAQRSGGDGLAEMPAYAAAVDALKAENQRVLALEEQERLAQPTPRNPSSGRSNTGGGSTNSGGGETAPSPSPSETTPPSTDPTDPPTTEPTDPPATEPIDPPVDPTDPPVDGTVPGGTP